MLALVNKFWRVATESLLQLGRPSFCLVPLQQSASEPRPGDCKRTPQGWLTLCTRSSISCFNTTRPPQQAKSGCQATQQ